MVKFDPTRDYYGDLGVDKSASDADIIKAFRKLALKYHPDRNPGREAEVNSQFQTIQSAHEILLDKEERAKYDSSRRGGRTTGLSSTWASQSYGQKGNPWANAGSQWAPPPKPPGSARKAPPTSAGAQRYTNHFANTPKASASSRYQQESPETKQKTYQAWERMGAEPKTNYEPPPPGPNRQARPAPTAPKESTPQSTKPPPPPRTSRASNDDPRSSTNAYSTRNSQVPGGFGASESQAPGSANYYSARPQPQKGYAVPPRPDVPPRAPPGPVDPLRQFRDKTGTPFGEPRLSTPYASSGGERTNPFESVNVNRSKSTNAPRDPASPSSNRHRSASPKGSKRQPNLSPDYSDLRTTPGSPPKRHQSNVRRGTTSENHPSQSSTTADLDTSSDEEPSSFGSRPRTYAQRRAARSNTGGQEKNDSGGAKFTETTNDKARQDYPSQAGAETSPKKYESRYQYQFQRSHSGLPYKLPHCTAQFGVSFKSPCSSFIRTPATAGSRSPSSEGMHGKDRVVSDSVDSFCSHTQMSHSGTPCLNPFELKQRQTLVDLLEVAARRASSQSQGVDLSRKSSSSSTSGMSDVIADGTPELIREAGFGSGVGFGVPKLPADPRSARPAVAPRLGSDPPKPSFVQARNGQSFVEHLHSAHMYHISHPGFAHANSYANKLDDRFSFDVDGESITPNRPVPQHFMNNSTENISTTFTPSDWHGKFEAGDYFTSEPNSQSTHARSGSRSRAKSPTKRKPVNKNPPVAGASIPAVDPEILRQSQQESAANFAQSPGGTKFSADEWASTFAPQTFAYPPGGGPSRTSSRANSRRTRTGSTHAKASRSQGPATPVDEESDDENIFPGRASMKPNHTVVESPVSSSPNAMDIDPPAIPQATRPQTSATTGARNVNVTPDRAEWRAGDVNGVNTQIPSAAGPSPHLNGDSLKTDLGDLKNVEPLQTKSAGLSSFEDLTSTLPFTSQASAEPFPVVHDFTSGKASLNLPNPPKAPQLPSIPAGAQKASAMAWQSYMHSFKAYMAEWDSFNTKIILHFIARKNNMDKMPQGWLEQIGDAACEKYCKALDEDRRVRTAWDIASEKHENAMSEFRWMRDVMKHGKDNTGRSDE